MNFFKNIFLKIFKIKKPPSVNVDPIIKVLKKQQKPKLTFGKPVASLQQEKLLKNVALLQSKTKAKIIDEIDDLAYTVRNVRKEEYAPLTEVFETKLGKQREKLVSDMIMGKKPLDEALLIKEQRRLKKNLYGKGAVFNNNQKLRTLQNKLLKQRFQQKLDEGDFNTFVRDKNGKILTDNRGNKLKKKPNKEQQKEMFKKYKAARLKSLRKKYEIYGQEGMKTFEQGLTVGLLSEFENALDAPHKQRYDQDDYDQEPNDPEENLNEFIRNVGANFGI